MVSPLQHQCQFLLEDDGDDSEDIDVLMMMMIIMIMMVIRVLCGTCLWSSGSLASITSNACSVRYIVLGVKKTMMF